MDFSDPMIVYEALQRSGKHLWTEAMCQENDSLMQNDTWMLTELPERCHIVDTTWVFEKNKNLDGSSQKSNAYLIVRGFNQSKKCRLQWSIFPYIVPSDSY